MSSLSQLNAVVQQGRGVVASILGNSFNVYRLGSAVSGSITGQAPTIAGYLAKLAKAKKIDIEASTLELEVFEAKCDNTRLQLGDILVGTTASDLTSYTFAQYRDLKPTLFVRVETIAKIFRPRANGAAPSSAPNAQPGQPYLASGFESSDLDTRLPIVLNDGVYALGQPTDTPALIPVGLQLTARAGGSRGANSLPGSSATARYVGYVPPLGLALNQDDEIYVDDDHTYIVNLALTETVGLVGTVCILEEEGV